MFQTKGYMTTFGKIYKFLKIWDFGLCIKTGKGPVNQISTNYFCYFIFFYTKRQLLGGGEGDVSLFLHFLILT